jgi:MoaA/NifB/PqqE/SkfB family radical SAM enzyme
MCGRGKDFWEISPKIIDQIISWFPFLELVTWQGGEVFLTKRFNDILQKTAPYKNMKQIIITNALLINEAWADKLTSLNNVDLTISIDGVTKDTYEYVRQGANFEKLIRNLKLINQARKRCGSKMITTLRATIMKLNYRHLERFVEFAKEYSFDVLLLAPLSTDCNTENFDPQDIFYRKDEEANKFIYEIKPRIRQMAREYKIKLLDMLPVSVPSHQSARVETKTDALSETVKIPFCFRPWKQLAMNVRGDIFPECLCRYPVGNIFQNTLEEVWNNEKMQMHRKKLAEFDYKYWCNPDCISGAIPPEHLKFTFA